MASETYLDVPGTEDAGRRLSHAAEEFKNSLTTLQQALDRDHGCWSDDRIGKQFEQSYLEPANQSREALKKLQESIGEFANTGLPNVVRNIQGLDSSYGDVMKQYENQIEEYHSKMQEHMLPTGNSAPSNASTNMARGETNPDGIPAQGESRQPLEPTQTSTPATPLEPTRAEFNAAERSQ